MTTSGSDFELKRWLDADPATPSSWILPSVIDHARRHPRRRSIRLGLRGLAGRWVQPRGRSLRLAALVAIVALALSLSAVLLGGGPIPLPGPTPAPSATEPAAPSLVPAAVCPPGTDPNSPGPIDQDRPDLSQGLVVAAFDRASGRVVAVGPSDWRIWTFDVCTNTWQRTATTLPSLPFTAADDPNAGVVVLFGDHVLAYDVGADVLEDRGWSPLRKSSQHAAFRSATGEIVVLEASPYLLHSYDPASDTWPGLDQPGHVPTGTAGADLLAYDSSVDRLVLFRAYQETRETFEFVFAIPTWLRPPITTPGLELAWGDLGRYEIAYDESHARTVAFSSGRVIAYDAAARAWEVVFDSPLKYEHTTVDEPAHRSMGTLVYDPVNARLVVVGGRRATTAGWFEADDLVAFDLATRQWRQLLAPNPEATPVIPWS